jgi:hypothetical protein
MKQDSWQGFRSSYWLFSIRIKDFILFHCRQVITWVGQVKEVERNQRTLKRIPERIFSLLTVRHPRCQSKSNSFTSTSSLPNYSVIHFLLLSANLTNGVNYFRNYFKNTVQYLKYDVLTDLNIKMWLNLSVSTNSVRID